MTVNIKEHFENNYLVTWDWEKGNYYTVQVCPHEKDGIFFGYPVAIRTYSINEKKKAEATYNRYIKRYCKGK